MSSFRRIYYHIIFSTKYRRPTIPEVHCEDLYRYIAGIIKNKKGNLCRINGAEEHIHIFSDLHPEVSLAGYIKDIKVASHKWMKESGKFPMFKEWQGGYAAFTHS